MYFLPLFTEDFPFLYVFSFSEDVHFENLCVSRGLKVPTQVGWTLQLTAYKWKSLPPVTKIDGSFWMLMMMMTMMLNPALKDLWSSQTDIMEKMAGQGLPGKFVPFWELITYPLQSPGLWVHDFPNFPFRWNMRFKLTEFAFQKHLTASFASEFWMVGRLSRFLFSWWPMFRR